MKFYKLHTLDHGSSWRIAHESLNFYSNDKVFDCNSRIQQNVKFAYKMSQKFIHVWFAFAAPNPNNEWANCRKIFEVKRKFFKLELEFLWNEKIYQKY